MASPFFRIVALLAAFLFFLPQSSFALTTAEEKELGREFMQEVRRRYELIQDPVILEYVNRVGQRVLEAAGPQPFDYRFYVVRENMYNAFAGPGGHVFIHSGLLAAMESEEELAGILAHEVAHVTCRHISEKISRGNKIQMAALAGMVASLFLGGGAATNALAAGSIAAGVQASLAYSRRDEMQADEVGLMYLAQAGYSPRGLQDILEKIRRKNWFGTDQVPGYLSTHPAAEDRSAYIETWIATHPDEPKAPVPGNDVAFHKVKGRLIALYGSPRSARQFLARRVEADGKDAAARYALGVFLMREGHREQALDHLKAAARLRPFDPDILSELGRAYLETGKPKDAVAALSGVREAPENAQVLFYLGRAYLAAGNPAKAESVLKKTLEADPDHLEALNYLGQAEGKLKRLAEAHFHLGVYHYRKGDIPNARFHLERALSRVVDAPALERSIREILDSLPSRYQTGEAGPRPLF
ncbi:MAG: M48 family metalloprotease [Deltaproteobacteria bacterium]|nr:M48 family metalloprotease [Deltaproteobacteria bacterium]